MKIDEKLIQERAEKILAKMKSDDNTKTVDIWDFVNLITANFAIEIAKLQLKNEQLEKDSAHQMKINLEMYRVLHNLLPSHVAYLEEVLKGGANE